MYLVDTNVLSAAAPTKAVPRQDLRDRMERNSAGLHLSVITIAEVEDGIARSLDVLFATPLRTEGSHSATDQR